MADARDMSYPPFDEDEFCGALAGEKMDTPELEAVTAAQEALTQACLVAVEAGYNNNVIQLAKLSSPTLQAHINEIPRREVLDDFIGGGLPLGMLRGRGGVIQVPRQIPQRMRRRARPPAPPVQPVAPANEPTAG